MKRLILWGLLFSCALAQADLRPILLVPGWGYDLIHPPLYQHNWDPYIQWLGEAGFPQKDIYVVNYDYMADLDTIQAQMTARIGEIVSSYPPGTRFDIFGHSLGGFTALYAVMKGGFAPQFQKFTSLSGIPKGWNGMLPCWMGLCGKAHMELMPFRSPFVLQFLEEYRDSIDKLEKCSLYSPADGFVSPYWAGRFEGGINVEVPDMEHLATIWAKPFFNVMINRCYGGNIAPN